MIVYLAADLIWASKIKGTADALGLPCRPVRTMDMLEARLAENGVKAFVADLVAEPAIEMIQRARREPVAPGERPIRIVAFGPHVEREKLQQARDAGADDVLTRGHFDHHLDELLISLAGRA
jgi:hypothetical protein